MPEDNNSGDALGLLQSDLVPGGILIYYADGDEEILHANRYVLDLLECDTFEELLELTGGSFRGFVHKSDVESTEDSIWGQVGKRDGLDHIYYQVRTKGGRLISVDDYGRLVQRPGERPLFYVFLAEMERGGAIDWLTGLPAMERFSYLVGIEAPTIACRGERPVVVVFDIMGMKAYNALNGRDAGDKVICSFANVLRDHFGSELCCRYDGDSFCVLGTADNLDDEMARVFEEFAAQGDGTLPPIMAGACEMGEGDDLALALDRAKLACDSDRSTWVSHFSWYTAQMRRAGLLRAHVLEHLDQALAGGWVQPHYQGVVRTVTGYTCGEEALARWADPVYGNLSPADFVPALEEAGLLHKMDLHIVDCVLRDLSERMRRGFGVVPVSVNISLRDLARVDVAQELASRADRAHIPHDLLRVEFTESAASRDPELLKRQVRALHEAGFEVWMDDFGSGQSSLNALKEFDFDLIKLDMGFFRGGQVDKRIAIVEGVIRAAKRLGVITLAEGVETQEQSDELCAMGCDMMQGFLYFRPTSSSDVMAQLDEAVHPPLEPLSEREYWNAVGSLSFADFASRRESEVAGARRTSLLPVGVVERRGNTWHMLRCTGHMRTLEVQWGLVPEGLSPIELAAYPVSFDDAFEGAIARCDVSGEFESVAGPLEYGSGFLFRVRPLTRCERASAYIIAGVPTSLGAALGKYGDVPVGYAVLSLVTDDAGRAVDAEYVYANGLYKEWSGLDINDLVGKRVMEVSGANAGLWVSLCERAVVDGKSTHDVVFSDVSGHWLSFNITPALTPGHCILAYILADAEQREREELIEAGTHDPLTSLLNRRGIDDAVAQRRRKSPDEPFVLVLLDVDDFKTVNDLYGHDVGDEALRVLSRELSLAFPPTAIIGRNGGDEALVALFGDDAADVERNLAELMARDISCRVNGRRYGLSLSAGYAWCTDGNIKGAYTRADEALYAVKLSGKSGYSAWNASMRETPQRSLLGFSSRELAERMPLAMLAHRTDGQVLFANRGFVRLLGYDSMPQALEAISGNLRGVLSADAWEHVSETIAQASERGGDEHVFELDVRVTACDGSTFDAVYRAQLVQPDDGETMVYAYIVRLHS